MDPINKILVVEDRLTPSSGFQSRVMDAVCAEKMRQPPLPFPWDRFAVGVAASLAWAAAGSSLVGRIDWSMFSTLSSLAMDHNVGYAALVIVGSLAVVAIPRLRSIE